MSRACSMHMRERNVYRLLVRRSEERRPLVLSRRKWVNNIRIHLVEIGCGDVD
jgi:hypothetical protein